MYEKIEAFCEKYGITIASFEKMCGLSENYVYKFKTKFRPSLKNAKRIAEVMGITLEEVANEMHDTDG